LSVLVKVTADVDKGSFVTFTFAASDAIAVYCQVPEKSKLLIRVPLLLK